MGTCWSYCSGVFRQEANRIQRGGGSKYFRSTTGEHYTIEFENLVESDDQAESPGPCPRPISEDEMVQLKEHRYAAITDQQVLIDLELQAQLEAEEEELRQEEEARNTAQRQAAMLARHRRLQEQGGPRSRGRAEVEGRGGQPGRSAPGQDFDLYLQNVKAQSEAFRSSRLSTDTMVTPNTESSCDFPTNDDGASLDLEWEDEEGMTRVAAVWERSRTEEDILRAALRPCGPASEDSSALEWENDFVTAHVTEGGGVSERGGVSGRGEDSVYEGFVNPALDTSSEEETQGYAPETQDR